VKKRTRVLFGVLGILLILGAAAFAYWRYTFPFGKIHRCDVLLYQTLRYYAEAHDGLFPSGETTPEASLSLLYRENFMGADEAHILRAITIPREVVLRKANSGQLLGPEMCGWHYAEGLRTTDSPELALFWDKAGVGHWGERLLGGGYIVTFVRGEHRHIPASEWPAFLDKQRRLLASRAASESKNGANER
jgi:hypothetical protein